MTTCQPAATGDNKEASTNPSHPIKNEFSQINAIAGMKDSAVVNAKLNQINIVPNPSNGMFTLEGSIKDMPGQVYISVSDLQGNILIPETLQSIGDKIDMTTLQNGVYSVCIRSTSSTILSANKKLIITK